MAEIKIYTTPYCPYCHMAKALLSKKGVEYEEVNVAGDSDARAWLREATGQSTVPQVFIGGVSYGGYSDIQALDQAGQLDEKLQAVVNRSPYGVP